MLWTWLCHVIRNKLFLEIAAPKRQIKSLKTTCEVVNFYYICKLYTWNLSKSILSKPVLKGLLKLLVMSNFIWNSKKSNNLLFRNFSMFINYYCFINLLLSFFFLFSKCLSIFFLGKPSSGCLS